MKTELLNYELPTELIAQTPCQRRKLSRLLVLDRSVGEPADQHFGDLIDYLQAGDCLVLNNTKVIPARFYAQKLTGAQLEGLFLYEEMPGRWQVLLKNARKIKSGDTIELLGRDLKPWCKAVATKTEHKGQWVLEPERMVDSLAVLDAIGLAPLPPYIKREKSDIHSEDDLQRYQTVYAEQPGAVAAPTAGLHFDQAMLDAIVAKGIRLAYVTLHVGIGTFRPVETETLDEHPMHEERYEIDEAAAAIINETAASGGRVIAVGTTSIRTLESVAEDRRVQAVQGKTKLFIQPGYQFKIVDAIVTNFHLPKSTLLALVAAFADLEMIMTAYKHAVDEKYRFFSYGDAMFIY